MLGAAKQVRRKLRNRQWAAAHFGDDAFRIPRNSDLKLWLRADRIIGAADGAAIESWSDVDSPSRIVLDQAIAANQPTYRGNVVNGKPVMRFDGVDDFMEDGAGFPLTFDFGDRYSVFVVAKLDSTGGTNQGLVDVHNDAATNTRFQLMVEGGVVKWRCAGTGVVDALGNDQRNNTFKAFGCFCDGSNAFYLTNKVQTATIGYTAPNGAAAVGVSLGQLKATPTYIFKGDIAEILIFGRYLQPGEQEKIWNYLGRKYALGYA